MKKILALVMMVMVFVISCGNNVKGEKGVSVTFNVEAEPTSLDPQILTDEVGFNITNMLYEGLVRLNENSEIVPAGAESWEVSEDGKTVTFKIRQGMKWSNGDPITAHDYFRGMKVGLTPEKAAEYAFLMYYIKNAEAYNTGEITDFEQVGIKVLDDYTLEFTLKDSVPYFVKTLIMPIYFPINEKALAEFGEQYGTEPEKSVYNGPFKLTEWVHDNKVVMERNENYWNNANTKIDKLTALMVGDYEAATNLFKNSELDLTKISIEKINEFKDETLQVPDGKMYYFAYNVKKPGLNNKKIRQALSLAINREELTTEVVNGAGIKAGGFVAGGIKGLNKDFREEAGDLYAQYEGIDLKALFEEGLKEEGLTVDQLDLTLTVDDKGNGRKEGEYYQSQWYEKLGVKIKVEVLTFKERIAKAKSGDFDIIRSTWGPDYSDAMTYLEIKITGAPFNISNWSNAEYDKLMQVGQKEQNEEVRQDAMKRAERILIEDFVYSPIYYQKAVFIKNPALSGVALKSVGAPVDLYNAEMKK